MKISVLKEDFYKRFGKVSEYLYTEEFGMICTLLGFSETELTKSLTTALYPSVYAVGCGDGTTQITIANTSSAKPQKHISERGGAKILFHSDIPPRFDSKKSEEICISHLLKKIGIYDKEDVFECFYSKKGYCLSKTPECSQEYPLPITGKNLVNIYTRDETGLYDCEKMAKKSFECIRKLLPSLTSLSEIRENLLTGLSDKIENKKIFNFLRFICEENERINISCHGLKKLDTGSLFSQIIISCDSMNKYLDIPDVMKDIVNIIRVIPEVDAYRYTQSGIFFIISEVDTDYAINRIRNEFMNKHGIWLNFCISGI